MLEITIVHTRNLARLKRAKTLLGKSDIIGRFTAWGKSSKVLVPQAAEKIGTAGNFIKIGGWLVTDAELAHAIYKCSGQLTGKAD